MPLFGSVSSTVGSSPQRVISAAFASNFDFNFDACSGCVHACVSACVYTCARVCARACACQCAKDRVLWHSDLAGSTNTQLAVHDIAQPYMYVLDYTHACVHVRLCTCMCCRCVRAPSMHSCELV